MERTNADRLGGFGGDAGDAAASRKQLEELMASMSAGKGGENGGLTPEMLQNFQNLMGDRQAQM